MPSNDSSPDECLRCGLGKSVHDGRLRPSGWPIGPACWTFLSSVAPQGSASPSPDECPDGNGKHCFDHRDRWCCHCGTELPAPAVPEAPELPCPEGGGCRRSLQCPDGCRRLTPEGPVSIPPRPPILVAYATGSGALNELALPGEASVAVVDGSLVISHASGVLGIQYVKPLELEN